MATSPGATGDGLGEGVDDGLQLGSALGAVGMAVGADDALVDRPGRFDLDVGVGCKQGVEPVALLVGEQAGAGAQRPSGPVERVVLAAPVAVQPLLNSASAPVEGVADEAHHVEGIQALHS